MDILVCGDSPYLAFYAWRLAANTVTLVSSDAAAASDGYTFASTKFKRGFFAPQAHFSSLKDLPRSQYDYVFVSAESLQSLSSLCPLLAPFIKKNAVVVVESTGFLQLENYVVQNLFHVLGHKNFIVLSIMSDSDMKKTVGAPVFVHQTKTNHDYVYIGCASGSSYSAAHHDAIDTLTAAFAASSIEVFKINGPVEFLNYQWKFALPRIVFSPLLILFELVYPAQIANQILAKPLISGLLGELLSLLKKMDCRLIKGYESESALLKTWSNNYPDQTESQVVSNPLFQLVDEILIDVAPSARKAQGLKYLFCPEFFYRFYNQSELDYDPLLLQPILLADDHAVKTPYLEFLYTTVCQLAKLNKSTLNSTSSLFFVRSTPQLKNVSNLEKKTTELANKNKSLEDTNQSLVKQINELSLQLNNQRLHVSKLSHERNSLQQQLQRNSRPPPPHSRRQSLNGPINGAPSNQNLVAQVAPTPQRSPSRVSIHKEPAGGSSSEDFAELVELSFAATETSRAPSPSKPVRSDSLTNIRKAANPKNQRASIKRASTHQSNQSNMPSLENQASFIDKPFGNSSTYLPINDVSSRFTPQSRKNRKSGMPMLTNRVPSGTNIHMMNTAAPAANSTGMGAANGNSRADIDDYSLYGGASLPSGAVRPPRNRTSSYKSLNQLGRQSGSATPSPSTPAPPTPTVTAPPQNQAKPSVVSYQSNRIGQMPKKPEFEGVTASNNSNDSKNSFNSSDGIFSNGNNNSSIDTQNTGNMGSLDGQGKESSNATVVLPEKVERSNTVTSGKKKSKMKSFFKKTKA